MSTIDVRLWSLACATWVGSLLAFELPPIVLLAVALGVGLLRRPWAVAIIALVLSAQVASWVIEDLAPVASQDFSGLVTLSTDPEPIGSALRADADSPLGRVQLRARGRAADDLRLLLAGDRVVLSGAVSPRSDDSDWLLQRKVVGLLTVNRVDGHTPAGGVNGLANSLRQTLERGAESLGPERLSLFTGLVVGDDRWQSPQTADDFRGSGLGHLLAVSGQNVAFVLLILAPLARWLPPGVRVVVMLGVLGFFALVTRFEPSVLRASVMAGLAVVSVTVGRPGSGLRLLGMAVVGLLWWDPLLGRSVGFQLSLLASLGILLVSPLVVDRLAGPRWFRELAAATVGAQVAVAPLLLWVFDDVPVAALPANVLAGPASGPVMAWGLTGGLLAGLLGGRAAVLLHTPTGWLLGWIAGVAGWASSVVWGSYGWRHVVAAALVLGVTAVFRVRVVRLWAGVLGVFVLLAPLFVGGSASGVVVGDGVSVWRSGEVTVVELGDGAGAERSLALLRSLRLDVVDLLVIDGASAQTVESVVGRYGPGRVADVSDPAELRNQYRLGDLWVRFATSSRGVQVLVDRIPE